MSDPSTPWSGSAGGRRIGPAFEAGTEVSGRYRLLERMGQGGMGEVWKALHLRMEREVALKLLPPEIAMDSGARKRLLREAGKLFDLDHPHIANVMDCDFQEDHEKGPLGYLAMELLQGPTLREHLAENGALTLEECVRILRPVAEALDFAHTRNVVHMDVKPANIIFDADPEEGGSPKLIDFSISHDVEETLAMTGSLEGYGTDGSAFGTPSYMSPEQFRAKRPRAPMDVWSLAVVAYQLLTDRLPFRGSPSERRRQIMEEEPDIVETEDESRDEAVTAILLQGLSKDPKDRPVTCVALIEQLQQVLEGTWAPGAAPAPESVPEGAPPPPPDASGERSSGGAGLLALGACVLLVVGGAAWFRPGKSPDPTVAPTKIAVVTPIAPTPVPEPTPEPPTPTPEPEPPTPEPQPPTPEPEPPTPEPEPPTPEPEPPTPEPQPPTPKPKPPTPKPKPPTPKPKPPTPKPKPPTPKPKPPTPEPKPPTPTPEPPTPTTQPPAPTPTQEATRPMLSMQERMEAARRKLAAEGGGLHARRVTDPDPDREPRLWKIYRSAHPTRSTLTLLAKTKGALTFYAELPQENLPKTLKVDDRVFFYEYENHQLRIIGHGPVTKIRRGTSRKLRVIESRPTRCRYAKEGVVRSGGLTVSGILGSRSETETLVMDREHSPVKSRWYMTTELWGQDFRTATPQQKAAFAHGYPYVGMTETAAHALLGPPDESVRTPQGYQQTFGPQALLVSNERVVAVLR